MKNKLKKGHSIHLQHTLEKRKDRECRPVCQNASFNNKTLILLEDSVYSLYIFFMFIYII